jgi:hypothetical protein
MTQQSRGLIPTLGNTESLDITGHLVFRDNPFAGVAGNYQMVPFKEGATVQEIVTATCAENSWLINYIEVQIAGQIIPRESWHLVRLKKTAPVMLMVIPQGGGGVGDVVKMVAMVAVMAAVTYFTLGTGSAAFAAYMGTMGVTGVGLAVAGAMVVMAAGLVTQLALNAVFPPPNMDTPSISMGSTQSGTQAQTYQFSLDTNSSWQYKPVPRVYGKVKMAPPYAARPFIESIGDQQYMYLIFDFGYGPLQLEDLRIADNPIASYQSVTYQIHQSYKKGDPLYIYNKDVYQEAFSLKLLQNSWRSTTSQLGTSQAVIDLSFSQGLVQVNSTNGDQENRTVDMQIQWRRVGDADWRGYGTSIITHQFVGGAVEQLDESTIRVTRATTRPFTISAILNYPQAGEYEFRVQRTTEDSIDRYVQDDVYLSSVRSVKNVSPLNSDVPHTIVEMRILANDQISGAVNNFTAVATSIVDVWDGTQFVKQATRNPAWHYLDVLKGTGAVRPAPASRIDLAGLKEWADWCDSSAANAPGLPRNQCDLVVSGEYTSWQVLKLITATGDASPALRSGKYSVAIDRPKSTPVQMFTPRNSWEFSSTRSYHIQPHGLRVQYVDPLQEWQQREILVFDDGYSESNATIYESLNLTGITNYHQAYRLGRHSLAQGRLRQETFSIKVGVENVLATRGDLVRLAYDIPKIGAGWGRIKSVDLTGKPIITLDAPFSVMSTDYWLRVRTPYGQTLLKVLSAQGNDTVICDGDTTGLEPGALVSYGESEKITMDCLVRSISPGSDLSATIDLVPYAPGVYTSETQPIPPYNPLITNLDNVRPGPVINLQATEIDTVINRYHYLSIAISWKPASGFMADRFEVYQKIDGKWIYIGETKENTFYALKDVKVVEDDGSVIDIIGKEFTYAVVGVSRYKNMAIAPEVAPHVSITPLGDTKRPMQPKYFDLDMRTSQQIVLDWDHPNNDDIDFYVLRYTPRLKNASITDSTIVVAKVAYPTTTVTVPARLGTYFIKTVDTSGLVSRDAAQTITPTEVLNNDILVKTIEDEGFLGTPENVTVTDGVITLAENQLVGYYYFYSVLALPQIYPAHLTSEINAIANTPNGETDDTSWNAYLEYRASEGILVLDSWPILQDVVPNLIQGTEGFTPWRRFLSGDYTIKQAQFRLVLESPKGTSMSVTKAAIHITTPVRVDDDFDIVCPATGIEIVFSPPFYESPALGITSDNFREGDSYQIIKKDRKGFEILFKNGANPVERQFDWIAKGYGTEVGSIPGYLK